MVSADHSHKVGGEKGVLTDWQYIAGWLWFRLLPLAMIAGMAAVIVKEKGWNRTFIACLALSLIGAVGWFAITIWVGFELSSL